MKKSTVLIIGAGSRGSGYSRFIKEHSDRVEVVGVAEPREAWRNAIVQMFNLPPERVFTTWEQAAALPRFADAVIIATPDALHEAPAVAFAQLGYHMLLEKPLAPTLEACRNIVAAVKKAGILFAVCHVLRYTQYTSVLKKLLKSGEIGELVSLQHIEPVRFWHQCHSFVRGNWRNTAESSCMLLQKCCHDLDIIRYLMDKRCISVQSFGGLYHFKAQEQPKGAADRCIDCPPEIESFCPASALKIYLRDRVAQGATSWPVNVLTSDTSREGVTKALREGPYGRCAYRCDNDVVDHQVVNMLFEDGATAQMTMTAFADGNRRTRIFGTLGEIEGDSQHLTIRNFLTGAVRTIDTAAKDDGSILSGHGGGDYGLMEAFVTALQTGSPATILSGIDETLESHTMVFQAEASRLNGKVMLLNP